MKFNKRWGLLILIPAIGLMAAGCDGQTASQTLEQQTVQDNQSKLVNAVPIPQLKNSLERANISKRLQTFDDPNKVSYIYLISFGKVMAFYTIKGKVTSSTKRLTSNQTLFDNCGNIIQEGGNNCSTLGFGDGPSLDGTYGNSDAYIFFWTTDNIYVQWSGDYMEVDQPLQLTTPPELVRQITK